MKIINTWICQVSGETINPVFGDIVISNGRISDIVKRDHKEFVPSLQPDSEGTINAGGRVTTLPNINFHDHFYSRLAKGLLLTGSTDNFELILQNIWWKIDLALDLEMIRSSAQMAVLDSIRNGVTYIFDHHSSPQAAEGSLNVIGNVLQESGLRGVLCFETTDRNGKEFTSNGLAENINYLRDSNGYDLKALLGLHASFTLDNDTLKECSEIVKETGIGIHIHLCEDKADRRESLSKFGFNPVDRLNKFGLLNNKSILAHGIHLTGEDYYVIEDQGSAIVYNIDSNLNNSVGLPELTRVPLSVPILTGTDGMNSNPSKTFKQLFLLARHQGMTFENSFGLIKKVYFDQLSFIRNYYPDFPSLQIQDRADMIIWDYLPPTPFLKNNFWGHFIYGILDQPIYSVIQNGNLLMNNYRFSFDDTAYQKSISTQGNRLFTKLNKDK
jgi:cytosine/adenosine deaminase-related metal-dependent hydrolase